MKERKDVQSIVPYIPLSASTRISWPSEKALEALNSISVGPQHSKVDSGQLLSIAISDIRDSLSLSSHPFFPSAPDGYALFFDQLMSREHSRNWFERVIPKMATLLLKLPSLLEQHYHNADNLTAIDGLKLSTGLRLLRPQEGGIVFLSQELIAALLACAFFCLFPTANRGSEHLPTINFDQLFAFLDDRYSEKQENKLRCIIHYFERVCSCIPTGFVSFERKVLPLRNEHQFISYPQADFWSESTVPLCRFEVHTGLIENQSCGALEVDFANRYLGGGALGGGCVQEEIRFMISPELIAGMLFLPSIEDNETVEIVGAERFSDYTGYASSFRFAGDYVDTRGTDNFGRRKTGLVAMDALFNPSARQYKADCLLREVNKAFCGFFNHTKYQQYRILFKEGEHKKASIIPHDATGNDIMLNEASSSSNEVSSSNQDFSNMESFCKYYDQSTNTGIATGNWGCGAFGGDPEVKSIIQWLAASQALRPFILYYTFGLGALQNIDQVSRWIVSHEWTVGDLWNILVEYCTQRLRKETNIGFFTWLLPNPPTENTDQAKDLCNKLFPCF